LPALKRNYLTFFSEEQWLAWIDQLSEDNYVIVDDFLPEVLFKDIDAFFVTKTAEDVFKKAQIGTNTALTVAPDIRGDYIYWLDPAVDISLTPVFEIIRECIEKLNRYCYLSLKEFEFHLALYPEKTFYKRHIDQFKNRSNRMISVILYLNKDWQSGHGGELKIYKDNGEELVVNPLANRLVMFNSAKVPHEVLVTHKTRRGLTGWLLYKPSTIGFLKI
jgi:SM-20-related protein